MGDPSALDPLRNPLRRAPLPVLGRAVEPIYAAVMARRNRLFDRGDRSSRFQASDGTPIRAISIGNLSVGGTGKTPMVMHVLRMLIEHGHRPCVAMRGYAKPASGTPDETDAYARAFPGVAIVAQPDRAAGVRTLLERTAGAQQPDVIVLDDGFQHRQIARDVDVVLIDATPWRSVFEDRLLPAGWLREPVDSLRRAGAVVLTHAELATSEHVRDLAELVRGRTDAPVAVTRHVWTGLKRRAADGDVMLPLDVLIGARIVGCCAIGHPHGFTESLDRIARGGPAGKNTAGILVFPDHDPLGPRRVRTILEMARSTRAEFIVVTDKDWSKLRHLPDSTWPCPIVRPELMLTFDSGGEKLDELVLRTVKKGK